MDRKERSKEDHDAQVTGFLTFSYKHAPYVDLLTDNI